MNELILLGGVIVLFVIQGNCAAAGGKPLVYKGIDISGLLRVDQYYNKTSRSDVTKASNKPLRSRPGLFERALGMSCGKDFSFNLDKWRELQTCNLFRNLKAQARSTEDGEVILFISGSEIPTTRFTPEISASAATRSISGGVSFEDRNFLGLGHAVEFFASKKEGKDSVSESGEELPPCFRIKWKDCHIGSKS